MCSKQANFGFELLRHISNNDSNKSIVISPISISSSLAIIFCGAKNETAKQIHRLIAEKNTDFNEIHQHFSDVLCNLNEDSFVNMVYFSKNLELLDVFKERMNKYYHGKFQLMDFALNYKAAQEIDAYIADVTADKIQNLVQPDMFNSATKMVLINAIYLNKKWLHTFNVPPIKYPFYIGPDQKEIKVQMLKSKNEYRYFSMPDCQVLHLPYNDENFSMIVILPSEICGLFALLKNIKIDEIINLIVNAPKETVTVTIPKFEIETTVELPEILKKLGMINAFDADKADFSGITEKTPLHVSTVIHKAVIEVSETGTKAAASTFVQLEYGCATISEKQEYNFIADHPFLYLITDQYNNIYFMGTFNKP